MICAVVGGSFCSDRSGIIVIVFVVFSFLFDSDGFSCSGLLFLLALVRSCCNGRIGHVPLVVSWCIRRMGLRVACAVLFSHVCFFCFVSEGDVVDRF